MILILSGIDSIFWLIIAMCFYMMVIERGVWTMFCVVFAFSNLIRHVLMSWIASSFEEE